MVITSRILQDRLGISKEVADYFANARPVPANNLFWKNKRIYLSIGFGFLTIPLAFDLMHKRGIPLSDLLDDEHVSLMEKGFDYLKRHEANEMDLPSFLKECHQLIQGKIRQHHLASDLFAFFSGKSTTHFTLETRYPALARSDFFLFTLVDLQVSDEWVRDFLPYWYALARPILLLDDFKDLPEDLENGEENTIIELGADGKAVERAYALGRADLLLLSKVNSQLADYMELFLKETEAYRHIQELMTNR
jgi:hypothetical protein